MAQVKTEEGSRQFSGYASVFNGVDAYKDSIVPGAYKDTLIDRERPVQMRWNHHGPVIGKWLEIKEDETGLYVKGELTGGHSVANDVYALLAHGAVTGMSIGYRERDAEEKDGIRYLKEIDLVEISVVETPADLGAQVGEVKSAIEQLETLKEFEALLRDVERPFSAAEAKTFVSRFKAVCHRDGESRTQTSEMDDAIKKLNSLFTTIKEA